MAETTYLIHNMFRAQSSHAQRVRSPLKHTSVERVAGRRILPKRPIRISEVTFQQNEKAILAGVREGRLGVTCPDGSFIDSRPDGKLFITYLDKRIKEEPMDIKPIDETAPLAVPPKLEDLPKEVIFGSDPVPYPDPPGPRTEPERSPEPETIPVESTPPVEPVSSSEEITKELDKPDEVLIQTTVPPVQDNQTITVDMPKSKKRRKE